MEDATEVQARAIVHAWMLHLGYTEEQIAIGEALRDHSGCEFVDGVGWDCTDENEQPLHPIHDEMDQVAELVMFVLERNAMPRRSSE